jgi:hypothetical protein
MGGERSSTARMRLAGKICAACKAFLPSPHSWGEKLCKGCQPKTHRIYMTFVLRGTWHCEFMEPYVQTALARKAPLRDPSQLGQFVERARGFKEPAARKAFEVAIKEGKGGIYLELTDEQYRKLTVR